MISRHARKSGPRVLQGVYTSEKYSCAWFVGAAACPPQFRFGSSVVHLWSIGQIPKNSLLLEKSNPAQVLFGTQAAPCLAAGAWSSTENRRGRFTCKPAGNCDCRTAIERKRAHTCAACRTRAENSTKIGSGARVGKIRRVGDGFRRKIFTSGR